jgi:hypothetical protein
MTAAGYAVPASLDMFGALLVKLCPIFDSVFIMRMLRKIIDKRAQVAHRSRVGEAADESRTEGQADGKSTVTRWQVVWGGPPQVHAQTSLVRARPCLLRGCALADDSYACMTRRVKRSPTRGGARRCS